MTGVAETPLQHLCFGGNDVTAGFQTVIFLWERQKAEPLSSEGRISIVSALQPCNLPPMKP